jgi:hypothetical protein
MSFSCIGKSKSLQTVISALSKAKKRQKQPSLPLDLGIFISSVFLIEFNLLIMPSGTVSSWYTLNFQSGIKSLTNLAFLIDPMEYLLKDVNLLKKRDVDIIFLIVIKG